MARGPKSAVDSDTEPDTKKADDVIRWVKGAGPSFEDWLRRAEKQGLNLLAIPPIDPPPGCASVFPVSQSSIAPDVLAPSSRAKTRGFRASAKWIRPDKPLSKPSRPSVVEVTKPEDDDLPGQDCPEFSVTDYSLRAPMVDWGKKQVRKSLGNVEYHRRLQSFEDKKKALQYEELQSQQKIFDLAVETRRIADESLDSALWQKRVVEAIEEGDDPAALFPKRSCPKPAQSATLMLGQSKISKEQRTQHRGSQSSTMLLQWQQELQRQRELEQEKEEKQTEVQPKVSEETKAKHWAFLRQQIKKLEDQRQQQRSQEQISFGQQPQVSHSAHGAMKFQAGSPRIQDLLEAAEKQPNESGNRPADNYTSLRKVMPG